MVYNPKKVTEEALRKHAVLADWDLRTYPFTSQGPGLEDFPLYITS
jgi:glycine amidinotransferase